MASEERFWAKVAVAAPDACWPWQASTNQYGYGVFWSGEKLIGAHVFSYVMKHGPLQPGAHVLHSCDRPECCNPAHLFSGDQQSNMQDKQAKGRQSKGAERPMAKLTEEAVAAIRASYVPRSYSRGQSALAKKYGVDKSIISEVLAGKRWKHVE